MTIKNAGYELNTETASEAQVNLASNLDTVTHTRNGIIDKKLLSCRTITEVSALPPLTNPRIGAIELAPQTLLTPELQ